LDEPFWGRCEVATGLIDTRTKRPAEQQTTIRVAYTQTHLYVAVECFDDKMSEIRASERRKDRAFTGDDWVEIHFDPNNSHRSKYAFFTNPLGTRAEANEGPSGQFTYGWTVDWECEARMETNRWSFEMKIPLGTMNYERKDARLGVQRHSVHSSRGQPELLELQPNRNVQAAALWPPGRIRSGGQQV
jgi:hypothetical protein